MRGTADESVGENFSFERLKSARDKTLKVIEEVVRRLRTGITESETRRLVGQVQKELGAEKAWHPPQVRFGKNTLLPFGEKTDEDVALKENDIFFLDLGPLFEDHEGDVGRTFVWGPNVDADQQRCAQDVEKIWFEVQEQWRRHRASGEELYAFAENSARQKGWQLNFKGANGHRVADFPHTARRRGSVAGLAQTPSADRWILEIQIRHPQKPFGAFYEDLLTE